MLRNLVFALAVSVLVSSVSISAQICPASSVSGTGIGDGCTTNYSGINLGDIPQIGVFRSTFTPACNNHDKCLTTLGTTVGQCNGNFLSDMLSACKSSYLPFQPDVYLACASSASAYRAAVDLYLLSLDTTAFPSLQSNALIVSKQLQPNVVNDTCGTSPERTTLYSPELIAHINGTFQTYAGRKPTIYEFLDSINASASSGDLLFVYDRPTWESYLISKAQYASGVHPPAAGFSLSTTGIGTGGPKTVTLAASPVLPGATYFWNLSKISTSPTINYSYSEAFSGTVSFSGYLKVTDSSGLRNMVVVDEKVILPSCSGTAKKQSSC